MVAGQRTGRAVKGDKREAILQAAWQLIRHYGYGKTTIAEIARTAGVGKGTAYLYFRSKEEIMLALVDKTNERITRELERIADGLEPPLGRLRTCLLHRVLRIYDIVHRYPHGEEVISSMKPAIVERIARHVRDHAALLARLLRELGVDSPDSTGQVLADLFEFLTPPYYHRFGSRSDLERFAARVADLTLAGVMRSQIARETS
jgi:TetR/AcrR family fatty acid metabolism transcriptional regulator